MVNQWYVYIKDEDFGPLFLKLSSYFPYNAKDRAQITGQQGDDCSPLRSSCDQLLGHIDQFVKDAKLAA